MEAPNVRGTVAYFSPENLEDGKAVISRAKDHLEVGHVIVLQGWGTDSTYDKNQRRANAFTPRRLSGAPHHHRHAPPCRSKALFRHFVDLFGPNGHAIIGKRFTKDSRNNSPNKVVWIQRLQ